MRGFLVVLLAFILALWGPIPSFMVIPGWVVRVVYLIALPASFWFVLKCIWRMWQPTAATEERLSRIVAFATAGALFLGAVLATQADYHEECTKRIQTRDGTECVGDYVLAPGPDVFHIFILIFAGALAIWFGASKHES